MMVGMTRARNRTNGLGEPPLIHLLLEALRCALVSLAQGAGSTLGMIVNRTHRNWRTQIAREDLPHTTSGISSHRPNTTHEVTSVAGTRTRTSPRNRRMRCAQRASIIGTQVVDDPCQS
ncbi:MAG: hypothetical protein ACOYLU_13985, partial [Limisphaerales bacterium]